MTANIAVARETVFDAPRDANRDGKIVLETRFGAMTFDRGNAIVMPRGLLGYADYREFALAAMPDPKLERFKLLQCLTESSLSFVVAPFNPESGALDSADIAAACDVLSIACADAAILLVVSTRRIGPMTQISVNLRAPVFVDTRTRTAWQYVLPNGRYPVRHVMGTARPAPIPAAG